MKYRIVEKDGRFEPQQRICFVWLDMGNRYGTITFPTIVEAHNYIDKVIHEKQKMEIIHDYP